MKNFITGTVVIIFLFSSCKENVSVYRGSAQFMHSYYYASGFEDINFYQDDTVSIIYCNSFSVSSYPLSWDIAKLYGDTAWYRPAPPVPENCYFNIEKIDIVCSADIDGEHPQGSSLNDIFQFTGGSYYNFIKNNYEPKFYHEVIEKSLSEMSEEEFKLLTTPVFFQFLSLPEKSGDYTFTITVTTTDGIAFSKDITVTF